jgi:hypothetical protein
VLLGGLGRPLGSTANKNKIGIFFHQNSGAKKNILPDILKVFFKLYEIKKSCELLSRFMFNETKHVLGK